MSKTTSKTTAIAIALLLTAHIALAQPAPRPRVEIGGRVAGSTPVETLFGLDYSILFVRRGAEVFPAYCYERLARRCANLNRGAVVVIEGELYADPPADLGLPVISIVVTTLRTR